MFLLIFLCPNFELFILSFFSCVIIYIVPFSSIPGCRKNLLIPSNLIIIVLVVGYWYFNTNKVDDRCYHIGYHDLRENCDMVIFFRFTKFQNLSFLFQNFSKISKFFIFSILSGLASEAKQVWYF